MPPGTAPGHTPALAPEPPSRWRAARTSVIAVVALVTAAVVTGPVTPPVHAAAAEPVSGFATVELVHVYNNYYRDSSYGIASTYEAGVPAEGDYFHSVNNPGRVASAATSAGWSSGTTSSSRATTRSKHGAA